MWDNLKGKQNTPLFYRIDFFLGQNTKHEYLMRERKFYGFYFWLFSIVVSNAWKNENIRRNKNERKKNSYLNFHFNFLFCQIIECNVYKIFNIYEKKYTYDEEKQSLLFLNPNGKHNSVDNGARFKERQREYERKNDDQFIDLRKRSVLYLL